MDYTFFLVDVFTEQRFGGNQLAVLPDARGLDAATMQALAAEFNFSETTFVLPAEEEHPAPARRVRIFTPRVELPFAGHPTVGTAAVLAVTDGEVKSGDGRLVLEEGVGPVEVELAGGASTAGSTFARFTVTAPYEAPDHEPSREPLAAALSLPEDAVIDAWYGGVGVNFCYVRLADADAVDRVVIDRAAWSAGVAEGWSSSLYVFADAPDPTGAPGSDGRLYARSFPLGMGIDEDPATGAACAGLVASLAVRAGEAAPRLRIQQGVRMGRPSLIEAAAHTDGGRLTGVSVGGHTVIVGSGTVSV